MHTYIYPSLGNSRNSVTKLLYSKCGPLMASLVFPDRLLEMHYLRLLHRPAESESAF